MARQNLPRPIRPEPGHRRGRMLADQEVEVRVIGHPVALVRGPHDLADLAVRAPASAHISRHVREKQMFFNGMPDRAFGEDKPGAKLAHRRVGVDQVGEAGVDGSVGHRLSPPTSSLLALGSGRMASVWHLYGIRTASVWHLYGRRMYTKSTCPSPQSQLHQASNSGPFAPKIGSVTGSDTLAMRSARSSPEPGSAWRVS